MANVAKRVPARFGELLRSPGGLSENVAAVMETENAVLAELGASQIIETNVAAEIREKAQSAQYPAIHLYCARVENKLREKFRTFSGTASMVAEIRVSQDRIEGIEQTLQMYADALTRVLDQRRGDWGDGMFYTGGYVVEFGPVKRGGKNLMQTATVEFDVHVGVD
jgi:hypothetical protein